MGQVEHVPDEFRYGLRSDVDGGEVVVPVGDDDLSEEGFLVAEVGVQPLLAGVGVLRDAVDSGTREAERGELGAGRRENLFAQFGG